jgi:hypothetical protein
MIALTCDGFHLLLVLGNQSDDPTIEDGKDDDDDDDEDDDDDVLDGDDAQGEGLAYGPLRCSVVAVCQ